MVRNYITRNKPKIIKIKNDAHKCREAQAYKIYDYVMLYTLRHKYYRRQGHYIQQKRWKMTKNVLFLFIIFFIFIISIFYYNDVKIFYSYLMASIGSS